MKNLIRMLLAKNGLEVRRIPPNFRGGDQYVLYDYKNENGGVDYERYKSEQVLANKKKIGRSYANEQNIAFISNQLMMRMTDISFGICHGTRQGLDQKWFKEFLSCDVFGTEISDTAEQFADTIEWDFHDVKDEWIGKFDFIYSNSLDHSYKPDVCLRSWISCLRPGGVCVIEHSQHHGIWAASPRDPFGAELLQMPYLIARWGQGSFAVREILDLPAPAEGVDYHAVLLIQKFVDDWSNAS